MKRAYVVDLSGRVDVYDDALAESLGKCESGYQVKMLRPRYGLLSLVPYKYATSTHIIKRVLKLVEGVINYMYLILLVTFKRPEILHMQWLPFMDFCGIEVLFLKLIKFASRRTGLLLTIHNVYPHNMSGSSKEKYARRFIKACMLIDSFIVHTHITKEDVIREFSLNPNKVNVCHHGVFVPQGITLSKRADDEKLVVLQFGGQSYYKGTDLLVEAIGMLGKEERAKVETRIVGGISSQFLAELKDKPNSDRIIWKPYFLSYPELYEEINNCDIVVLPYRAISQSGVLLTAIFFEKFILCSDLPSFVETLSGGTNVDISKMIFKSENAESLCRLLQKYIHKDVDAESIIGNIRRLKELYSWDNAAKKTISIYGSIGRR